MKDKRKKLVRIVIIALLLQIIPECMKELNLDITNAAIEGVAGVLDTLGVEEEIVVSAGQDYGSLFSTDPEIISRINYAVSKYGPGGYFSKNGKACTCHGKRINHVNSPWNCNCLRYVEIHGSTVDLQSVQCFGYAMYMQMCILGTTQFKSSGSFSYYYGSSSAMSGLEMERFFVEHASVIHPGTHMRCKYGTHSISIMAIDYINGKVTYIDANNEGNCNIRNFTTITWNEFANRFKNINYISVYRNFYSLYAGAPDPDVIAGIQDRLPTPTPTRRPNTPTPSPSPADYPIGLYKVTADPALNLREDTYTSAKVISKLPYEMLVEVFDFAYNKGGHHWGLIDTEEGSGWSSMGFLELVAVYTPTPTPTYQPADFETGTYVVTATNLMVRERQTTNSNSLGKISKGTMVDMIVFVLSDNGSRWGYVTFDDKNLQGWVSMDYMEIVPTETPTPTPTGTSTPTPTPTKVIENTPTPEPTDTPTPTPTMVPEHIKGESGTRVAVVAVIVAVCIGAGVFIFLKKKKIINWPKKRQKPKNKSGSGKVNS